MVGLILVFNLVYFSPQFEGKKVKAGDAISSTAWSKQVTDYYKKTKAIIPVDIAGVMCNYDRIFQAVENKKFLFRPNNDRQKANFSNIFIIIFCKK